MTYLPQKTLSTADLKPNSRLTMLENLVYEMQTRINGLVEQIEQQLPGREQADKQLTAGPAGHQAVLEVIPNNNGFPALCQLMAPAQSNMVLQSERALKLKGSRIQLRAENVLLESKTVAIDGELSAKMSYSKPFVWRAGQERVRLYSARQGFPILTKIVNKKESSVGAQASLYIDPKDQYWYLEGQAGMAEIESIFVGKQ